MNSAKPIEEKAKQVLIEEFVTACQKYLSEHSDEINDIFGNDCDEVSFKLEKRDEYYYVAFSNGKSTVYIDVNTLFDKTVN